MKKERGLDLDYATTRTMKKKENKDNNNLPVFRQTQSGKGPSAPEILLKLWNKY